MAGFEVDNLSLVLLAIASALIVLHSLLLRAPDSTLHPIVLGRQGESSKVRNQRESAVYTNSNASGMLVARAQTGVKTVKDLVYSSASRTPDAVKQSIALYAKALVHFLQGSNEGDARHLIIMTGDEAAEGSSSITGASQKLMLLRQTRYTLFWLAPIYLKSYRSYYR